MKLRLRKSGNSASQAREAQPEEGLQELGRSGETERGRWSTTFLIVGSALLGATALALWNRRTIANMRAQIQARAESTVSSVTAEEEIF